MSRAIDLSVVIPTRNRAPLLERVLESFARQTVGPSAFEVIVADDASTDETDTVAQRFADRLDLTYRRVERGGTSAARNAALEQARGRLILLADDDDLAAADLVAEHLRVHAAQSSPTTAVLGYTTWDPALRRTELMHFVTDVGGFLLSYGDLRDGADLDYHYFWANAVSVSRELLLDAGGFDTRLVALEDVELGHRLAARGMRIHFARAAVKHMLRPYDFESFCARCERTGHGLARLRAVDAELAREYERLLLGGVDRTADPAARLAAIRPEVAELERRLERRPHLGRLDPTRRRLYRLYDEGFRTATRLGALA